MVISSSQIYLQSGDDLTQSINAVKYYNRVSRLSHNELVYCPDVIDLLYQACLLLKSAVQNHLQTLVDLACEKLEMNPRLMVLKAALMTAKLGGIS